MDVSPQIGFCGNITVSVLIISDGIGLSRRKLREGIIMGTAAYRPLPGNQVRG
jgi:hypothetical protein